MDFSTRSSVSDVYPTGLSGVQELGIGRGRLFFGHELCGQTHGITQGAAQNEAAHTVAAVHRVR